MCQQFLTSLVLQLERFGGHRRRLSRHGCGLAHQSDSRFQAPVEPRQLGIVLDGSAQRRCFFFGQFPQQQAGQLAFKLLWLRLIGIHKNFVSQIQHSIFGELIGDGLERMVEQVTYMAGLQARLRAYFFVGEIFLEL